MLKAAIPRRAGLRRFRPSPTIALSRNDRNSLHFARPQSSSCPIDQSFFCPSFTPTTTPSSPNLPGSNIKEAMGRATKINMAQQILNYKFQNEDLLWEALQAPASDVAMLNGRKLTQGNKGLAGVGDAVISLVIKSDCYRMDRSIGETSQNLHKLTNNHHFASKCRETGLGACINKNQSMQFDSPRTLADTLEAVIGAVYLDGGIDNVKLVMKSLRIF
ncbi:ribonuclease III domain-containing protein [Xylaria cubensis]|nr:ribonuclease III domain-containing protein [Xylaria cubensis]